MKIRTGFVSNSSSSSFILAFDKMPDCKCTLQKLIFGNDKRVQYMYDDGYASVEHLTDIIWDDLQRKEAGPLTAEQVKDAFNSGWLDNEPEYDYPNDLKGEVLRQFFDARRAERKVFTDKAAEAFMAKNEGKIFMITDDHEDHDPVGATLDHGDVFHRVPNHRCNHH